MKIGLALGGGASRGIAHIAMLEAFDELGIKPAAIAGCSIGALIGAGYAGGMSALEIRDHALVMLSTRTNMARHIFGARHTRLKDIIALKGLHSLQIEGHTIADIFLPDHLAKKIEDLAIPFHVVTTDYDRLEEVVLRTGSVSHAVGASIAIPGLIAAPRLNGRLHIDGASINPVPFEHVREGCDFVVAIDVIGRPRAALERSPSNIELAIGSALIMARELAEMKRRLNPPEIYIYPNIDEFGPADFFKVREILEAAHPAKQELKRELDRVINAALQKTP